ncbi:cytotoxic T-lymphocyte protein 4 [Chanos chanos]|uniref:Cytotoxic T-lymphocyte protein 4 n=1 Tax=Chanos chanos TaxID=29144 RepID=A0A6J2WFH7_CHACN|nr:cytotoxic T-lymphocyte protein 4-like [Chanos chanos]
MIAHLVMLILCIPVGTGLRVTQLYRAVGSEGQAGVHCSFQSKVGPEELYVSLYKGMYGHQKICGGLINTTVPYIETQGEVRCRGELGQGWVNLTVYGLKGSDTDLYRCRVAVLYPPPYVRRFGNGTLVYIPDHEDDAENERVLSQSEREFTEW